MNLSWLDDFLALADTLNFSRAADERHMTQPAFSRRIRALEQWLGVPLFDRSAQPVRLTPAGEWFRDNAHDLLKRVARLPEQAREVAAAHEGALRFCATHALSLTFLPTWLRRLEMRLPGSRLDVMSDVLSQCEQAMLHGRAQFMLCHAHAHVATALRAPDFYSVAIGQDTLHCVGQPAAMRAWNANGARPVLRYSETSGLGRVIESLPGTLFQSPDTEIVFTAHLATMLRAMALDGRGLAYLPASLIEADLESGTLVRATDIAPIALDIRLYRASTPLAARAQALWDAAVEFSTPT